METWHHLLNFLYLMEKLILMEFGLDYGTANGSGNIQVDNVIRIML